MRKHAFRRQIWPSHRSHEYGNLFCAECGLASWAKIHKPAPPPPQRRQDPEVEAVLAAARISRQEFLGQTEHMREAYADAILDDWERDSGLDTERSED